VSDAIAYTYAVIRLVPDIERGEQVNVGLVLFAQTVRFLGLRHRLDERKVAAIAPACDAAVVRAQLEALEAVAAGSREGGPIARLTPAERFHWLTAPSSTILQPGPVHTGMTGDPAATLERLFAKYVG